MPLLAALVLLLGTIGCSTAPPPEAPTTSAAQQTDAAVRRDIVSLSAPLTETIYLLNQQERIAAVSDSSVFPEQVVADRASGQIQELGPFSSPDLDALAKLQPNLILTSTAFQRDLSGRLRELGYNVMHFEPESIEDIFRQTMAIGDALGKHGEAAELVSGMRRELGGIEQKSRELPAVRVYMELNHMGDSHGEEASQTSRWTSGKRSPETEIIRIAGGKNVFADADQGVFVVSDREIVERNPDIILSPIWKDAHIGGIDGISTLAAIFARPGYGETPAGKTGRVLYYDSALLKHQGTRIVLAVRKLAYLLHPSVFDNPPGTLPWELGRIIE